MAKDFLAWSRYRSVNKPGPKTFDDALFMYKWVVVAALVNLLCLEVFDSIYKAMAVGLNEWENHRLQTDFDYALVMKNCLFEAVNNYFVLVYIAYVRWLFDPEGHEGACDESCLSALQIKLFIIFTGRTYGQKIVEFGEPLLVFFWNSRKIVMAGDSSGSLAENEKTDAKNTLSGGGHSREETTTLHVRGVGGADRGEGIYENEETLMRVFSQQWGVVISADIRHRVDLDSGANTSWALVEMGHPDGARAALQAGEAGLIAPAGCSHGPFVVTRYSMEQAQQSTGAMRFASVARLRELDCEHQSKLESWQGTFEDYRQMVVQFGYVALFAPACPLAPLLAILNNVTEIRTDAFKVCSLYQRTTWSAANSIGAWGEVVKAVGVVAVLVQSTMLCFVGSQTSSHMNWVQDEVSTLSSADVQLVEFESDTTASEELLLQTGIQRRLQSWKLWVLCFAMEHGVLLLRYIVSMIWKSQPEWVEDAKKTLQFHEEQMQDENASMQGQRLEIFGSDGQKPVRARQIFKQLDADGSGLLNSEEIRWCMILLGHDPAKLTKILVQNEMALMRTNRDGFDVVDLKRDIEEHSLTAGTKKQQQAAKAEALQTRLESVDFRQFRAWWQQNYQRSIFTLMANDPYWNVPPDVQV